MVPECVLAGADLLGGLPARDPVLIPEAAADPIEVDPGRARDLRMALGRIGQDHLMAAGAVLEEVVDPLFLHEPAGEVEVRLAVLDAIVAGGERAPDLVGDVEP